jgi:hypothetical protein
MFLIAEGRGSTPLPPQPSRIERSVTASRFSSRFAPSLFCKKSQKLNPLFSNSSALFKKENSDNSFPTNHFCTLLQNTGSVPTPFFSVLPLLTIHDSRFTNSFRIRTSEKHARKPCRMRTSKTRGLKSFRIRSYKKTGEGGGVPPAVTSPTSRPYFFPRDGNKPFTQSFAAGRRQWTRREIAGTLLVTRRASPRARPPFRAIWIGSQCSQCFPFPSPITKRK